MWWDSKTNDHLIHSLANLQYCTGQNANNVKVIADNKTNSNDPE